MNALIAPITGFNIFDVENLYITDYRGYLEQAVNQLNAKNGQPLSFLDSADKRKDFINEINFFKRDGRLN